MWAKLFLFKSINFDLSPFLNLNTNIAKTCDQLVANKFEQFKFDRHHQAEIKKISSKIGKLNKIGQREYYRKPAAIKIINVIPKRIPFPVISHTGFRPILFKQVNWSQFLKSKQVSRFLATLSHREKKRTLLASLKVTLPRQNKIIYEDEIVLTQSAIKKNTLKAINVAQRNISVKAKAQNFPLELDDSDQFFNNNGDNPPQGLADDDVWGALAGAVGQAKLDGLPVVLKANQRTKKVAKTFNKISKRTLSGNVVRAIERVSVVNSHKPVAIHSGGIKTIPIPASLSVRKISESKIDEYLKSGGHSALIASNGDITSGGYKMAEINWDDDLLNIIRANFDPQKKKMSVYKYSKQVKLKVLDVTATELRHGFNFDFIPDYDLNDFQLDGGMGEILFIFPAGQASVSGSFNSQNKIRTRVDLHRPASDNELIVPLIDTDYFDKLIDMATAPKFLGGHALFKLHTEMLSIDLDAEFDQKIFLDENFSKIKDAVNASYVLFSGIELGNVFVQFMFRDNVKSRRAVLITATELFYADFEFLKSENFFVELWGNSIYGNTDFELTINAGEILNLNNEERAEMTGLNRYEYLNIYNSLGMRHYLELSHLENYPIIIGLWGNEKVFIPSENYIENLFTTFALDDLKGRCLVQFNLNKSIKDFKFGGISPFLNMQVIPHYLDNDGQFTREVSPLTEKVFLIGNESGIFSIQISYNDGTFDYLTSICSEETYLVEQL